MHCSPRDVPHAVLILRRRSRMDDQEPLVRCTPSAVPATNARHSFPNHSFADRTLRQDFAEARRSLIRRRPDSG
ncbi:hypothetical protein RE6C_05017 [Rhodopirellula europaea 6C]|uniref:Uncharacterized protein n=1 Tax=Rhodopirellula europaea 6C TaxID=1263867 RepID=M2A451_9BACT|nr:hypothetical protein RE6C_05017 [Rhodopirellula europaea 6C]